MITQASSNTYIAVDIGGTNTRLGLFESLDSTDFVVLAKFPTVKNYEEQIRQIVAAIQSSGREDLAGIGVSAAARIARDGRAIIFAPNLPGYIGKPFAQDLFERFACPVRLAHDTVCGLLAEKKFGALRDIDRCAYLTVSTGTRAPIHLSKPPISLTSSIHKLHHGLHP